MPTISRSRFIPVLVLVFAGANACGDDDETPADAGGGKDAQAAADSGAGPGDLGPTNSPPTISGLVDQTTKVNVPLVDIPFTIDDAETPPDELVVEATSMTPALIASSGLALGGSGRNRLLTITPVDGATGTTQIRVTVDDGTDSAWQEFSVTVEPNSPPTISDIRDVGLLPNTDTGTITFTIGDADSPASSLILTAVSSNKILVPDASIYLGGVGGTRTIRVVPARDEIGTTNITVTVSDGLDSASDTFRVTVTLPPSISDIADQTIDEDTSTNVLSFTVDDAETALDDLVVTASSDNPNLATSSSFAFGGSGANRTLQVTPAANANGVATITVTVDDGALTASDTFILTVNPVEDLPTISDIPDQTIPEDGTTGPIAFTMDDPDIGADALVVTLASSNTNLVPEANLTLAGTGSNRTIEVVPVADASGLTTITITVDDGNTTASDSFDVEVTPVNDPPTISDITDQITDEDVPLGPLSFTVDDIDDPVGSLVVTAVSSRQNLIADASIVLSGTGNSRSLSLAPEPNAFGSATITIRVTDPGNGTVTDVFSVTVNAVNDAPVANPDQYLAAAGTTGNVQVSITDSVLDNDEDVDGPNLTVTPQSGSGNTAQGGDLTLLANGTFTYTPAPGFYGLDSFTYELNDNAPGENLTAIGNVTIEVSLPMTWFVDNTAAAPGDGRDVSPFARLKSVETAPVTGLGDTILVARGDGTTANQNEGVILKNNQILVGEILPSPPKITNTSGDAVQLANANRVASLEIVGPTGAAIAGASGRTGSFTLSDLTVTQGQFAIDVAASPAASFTIERLTVTGASSGIRFAGLAQLDITDSTVASTNGLAVDLAQIADASVTFSSVNKTGQNGGILLSNNTGSFTFSALTIDSTGGVAFRATQSGNVTLGGTNSSLKSTTALAADISGTTINVDIRRLEAQGGPGGIRLTDAPGSFRVRGDGTNARNGSGGTINNTTGTALELTRCGAVTLSSMSVLSSVAGLSTNEAGNMILRGLTFDQNTAGQDMGVILNPAGTVEIRDSVFQHCGKACLASQTNRAVSSFVLDGVNMSQNDAGQGDHGLYLVAVTGGDFQSAEVRNSRFEQLQGFGVGLNGSSNGAIDVTITNSTFIGDGSAIDASLTGTSELSFDISNNTIHSQNDGAVVLIAEPGSNGRFIGTLTGNTIGSAANVASASGSGIVLGTEAASTSIVAVRGNTITNIPNGPALDTGTTNIAGRLDLTVENNVVNLAPFIGYSFAGLTYSNLCLNLRNNDDLTFFPPASFAFFTQFNAGEPEGRVSLQGFSISVENTVAANGNMGTVFGIGTNFGPPPGNVPCLLP